MQRKAEVIKLLQELPIRHNDKIRMKDFILDTKDALSWSGIEERARELRKKTEEERDVDLRLRKNIKKIFFVISPRGGAYT